jgi:hypothetical protein
MNNDILSVPTPGQTPEPVVNTDKPKSKKGLFIAIGVVLVIAILTGVYFLFIRGVDKKQVINGTVNKFFGTAAEAAQKIEDILIIDYKKDVVKSTGSFKVSYDTNDSSIKTQLGGLTSATLNYGMDLDLKNLEASLDLELLEGNNNVAKFNTLLKNKNFYIKSDLFTDIFKYDLSNEIDWNSIDIDKLPDFKADAYTKLIKKANKLVIDNIKDEYLTQESVNEDIDGVNVKGLKTTLTLDEKNSKQFAKDLLNAMKNDDEFVELLASIAMKDKDEIKESLDDAIKNIDEEKQTLIAEEFKTSKLNIYTTKQGKFLALTLAEEDKNALTAVSNKGVTTIKFFTNGKESLKVDYNEKDKEIIWNNENAKANDIKKVTVKLLKNGLSIKLESDAYNVTLSGTEDITKESISTNYSAEANMEQAGKNYSAKAEWTNKVEKGDKVNEFSTTSAKNIKYLTDEDSNKLGTELITNLNKSTIGQMIVAMLQSASTTNTTSDYYDIEY